MSIKSWLKQNSWSYTVNARLKAGQTKLRYKQMVHYYAALKPQGTTEGLLKKLAGDRIARLRAPERPLNIFFLGTDYLQDSSGILQAIERLGKLTYFTKIIGEYGHGPSVGQSYVDARPANSDRLWRMVQDLADQGIPPDLLIGQSWASLIDGSVLSRIRHVYGTIVVNISMDDRHAYWGRKRYGQWMGTAGLIPHVDLAATSAMECVDWYLKEGCPAIFFPEASDPKLFHPMPDKAKIYDACFVGGRYGVREKLVKALWDAGIKVVVFGSGWKTGRIATEKVPQLFAQSKIILGVGTIGHCEDLYSLKTRDFDATMSGSFYLTHDNPDLYQLFEVGKEIETYRTKEECVEKARYYLRNEVERESIAKAGYERASQQHTWQERFEAIIHVLKAAIDP